MTCRYDRVHRKWRWVTGNWIVKPMSSVGHRFPWTRFAWVHPRMGGDEFLLIREGRIGARSNSGIKRGWHWKQINRFVCEWDY